MADKLTEKICTCDRALQILMANVLSRYLLNIDLLTDCLRRILQYLFLMTNVLFRIVTQEVLQNFVWEF